MWVNTSDVLSQQLVVWKIINVTQTVLKVLDEISTKLQLLVGMHFLVRNAANFILFPYHQLYLAATELYKQCII